MTVRELNGWAPASVTFDPDGDVLSVTVSEPRFTPGEKALLLASRRAERDPRGEHGFLLSEAADPANQFAFHVPPPSRDWAQVKLNEAQAAYQKRFPDTDLGSLLWRVEKTS